MQDTASQTEETTTPDDVEMTYADFNADREREMKTDKFPHRVDSKRYDEIQKCLNERLNGRKFDYKIYMECAGCTYCEDSSEDLENQTEKKVPSIQSVPTANLTERLKQNLKAQRNVHTNDHMMFDINSTAKVMNSEIHRLSSELNRMSDEFQKLAEEKNMIADELQRRDYEERKRYLEEQKNADDEYEENPEISDSNETPKKGVISIDIFEMYTKVMSLLNDKDDDQYSDEDEKNY